MVRLDPDFHETEVLVDSTQVPGFIYNVIPSPADSSILAIYTQNPQQEKPEFLLVDTRKQTVLQRFARCFSGVWSQQGDQFFFAELVPDGQGGQLSHIQVWHLLSGKRTLLYQETDSAVYSFVRTGGDALFVQTYLTYTQVKLTRISLSTGQIHLMNPGSFHNVNFIGTDQGMDYFTTDDQASRGRIIACPTGQDFRKANEVVPQQDRILQSACLVQGQLVCFYLNDGVCELCLIDPRHSRSCPIPLPDPCGTITLLSEIPLNIRSGSPFLFFQFQSFQFPPCILRLSVTARKVEPLQKIASHASFCVEKVAIAARDTTRLLAFLAYDPQQGPVESMPAIMYGYGGFAVCNTPIATNPVLHMDIAEWVRRGGLYIQCIVRGGGEFGEQWHQQGIGENKIHAVHDFIDIAQELIRRRLCHPDRLAAVGGSCGGTLVLSAAMLRPDLFRAVISVAGLTDMIRYRNDARGAMYASEFGDPRDPQTLRRILEYSPYHHVQKGVRYPALLLIAGQLDQNVPPYHSRKLAAQIQSLSEDSCCLLRSNDSGAHNLGEDEELERTCREMITFLEYWLRSRPAAQ